MPLVDWGCFIYIKYACTPQGFIKDIFADWLPQIENKFNKESMTIA